MDDSITLKQIENMKHCIGFRGDRVKRRKYVAFRNYYTTGENDEGWRELVRLGYATGRKYFNGIGDNPHCYGVTNKGFELLERIMECKITELD